MHNTQQRKLPLLNLLRYQYLSIRSSSTRSYPRMVSSPARRRQSIRTPQRRVHVPASRREEDTFDPFVPTARSSSKALDTSILKETLLLQLNSRIGVEPAFESLLSTSALKHHAHQMYDGTSMYDNEHKRLFSSMKSIASPRTISLKNTHSRVAANLGAASPHSASKRPVPQESSNSMPNKRRKVEMPAHTLPKPPPSLAFNFDRINEEIQGPSRAPIRTPTQIADKDRNKCRTTARPEVSDKFERHLGMPKSPMRAQGRLKTDSSLPMNSPSRIRQGVTRPQNYRSTPDTQSGIHSSIPKRVWK